MFKMKFKFWAAISVFVFLVIVAIVIGRLVQTSKTPMLSETVANSLVDETKVAETTLAKTTLAEIKETTLNVIQLKAVNTESTKTNYDNSIVTNKAGTITMKDGNIQLWQNEVMVASFEVPEPEQKVKNFSNCPLYVDIYGRLICLQTYQEEGNYEIKYTVLREDVEKLITTTPNYFIKNSNGEYGILRVLDEYNEGTWYNHVNFEFDEKEPLNEMHADIIWLNDNTIENLSFSPYVVTNPESIEICFWALSITLKDEFMSPNGMGLPYNIEIYRPGIPKKVDREYLEDVKKAFNDIKLNEYDEDYKLLLKLMKN